MTLPGASPPAGATSKPSVATPARTGPPSGAARPSADRPSDSAPPAELGRLSTEAVRPGLDDLDLLGTADLVSLIAADSRRATEAVVAATASISTAVDVICSRLAAGGRLVYVGAGTAGRLAALDAAELGPTFNVPTGMAEAVLAGGDRAMRHSIEGAEDDEAAGAAALEQLSVGEKDVVIGVSASGRTPFVLGAIARARAAGAATIGVACNAMSKLSSVAETPIELEVGGEVIAGSSRMNAGTAQKIALNTLSTAAMVKLGKTYGNLMVDLRATNTKLRDRAVRIVQSITGVGPQAAAEALEAAGWDAKLACLLASSGKDLATVGSALEAAGGRLRQALALVGNGTGAGAGRAEGGPHAVVGPASAGHAPGGPAPAGSDHTFRTNRGPKWKRLGVGAAFVDGVVMAGDVAIDQGVVVAVGLPGSGSSIAVPGLVDLQVNGYAGVDAAHGSVEELEAMGLALARHGVLAYQPTLITGDPDLTSAASARIGELSSLRHGDGARVLGVHLEGPFLSPERPGTHPLEWLRAPDAPLLRRLVGAGPVTMVTIAPELPGALALVGGLSQAGIVVSLGHSAATAAQAAEAVRAGASVVTHLFNAMTPVSSRSPGLPGLALSDPRLRVQLIADGVHVADELVRLAFAAAPGRCSIWTAATSRAGRGDGQLMLGAVPITLSGGVARRPDGTIAGGASTLLSGLRRLCSLSVALPEALKAVTEGPARILGRPDVGHLRQGGAANLLVLDDRLELRDVLVDGRSITPD
ncbi:MAG: N-acetylmuramic acid 6-phosphate etherase [Acidimicrobiales bacterium]